MCADITHNLRHKKFSEKISTDTACVDFQIFLRLLFYCNTTYL